MISSANAAAGQVVSFMITNTKLYVLVVNTKLLLIPVVNTKR